MRRALMTLLTLAASAWKWTATVVTMPLWLPVRLVLRRAGRDHFLAGAEWRVPG
jgi:hypothetical protein